MNKGVNDSSGSGGLTAIEFSRLYATWHKRSVTISCRYTRNLTAAEDLVSDSFVSFWENKDRLPTDSTIECYLLKIVKNKCLDWLRAQSLHMKIESTIGELRRRQVEADIRSLQNLDPDWIFTHEINRLIQETLEKLPELTKNVFMARHLNGNSYKEIAGKYGISPRRVESELEKAIKKLRVCLKDYLPFLALLATMME